MSASRVLLLPLGLLSLVACKPDTDCPPGSSWDPVDEWCVLDSHGEGDDTGTDGGESGSGDSGSGGDDTGESADWLEVPEGCEDPGDLGEDPVSLVGQLSYLQEDFEERLVEFVDVVYDEERELVYGLGQGGLLVFDISDPTSPTEHFAFPYGDNLHGRYHRVARQGDRYLLTNRDSGLATLEQLEDGEWAIIDQWWFNGLSAMQWYDETTLLVGDHGGRFHLFDLDGTAPATEGNLLGSVEISTNIWELKLQDGLAYVADGTEGLVIADVSDLSAEPVILGSLDLGSGAQDVVVDGEVAYLAIGAAGIASVDVSVPQSPALLDIQDYGSSVQGIALDGDKLWAVNQEAVIVLDVSDPSAMVPLGMRETEQWSMNVDVAHGYGLVGDWNIFELWALDDDNTAPDADLNPSEVFVREEGETFELELANRGSEVLEIVGMEIAQAGFSLRADRLEVAPGEVARVQVSWEGGAEVETELCLATNDPGAPTQTVELHSGSGGSNPAIGNAAPDFQLEGTDGSFYRLSEQLGHPVVLVYFATW